MSVLDVGDSANGPNPSACYAYGTIIAGLYAQTDDPAKKYAQIANSRFIPGRIDPSTYEPDYNIVADNDTAVVCLAGTTNVPQWLGHAGSALSPIIDVVLDKPGVASFILGTAVREPEILDKLTPWVGKKMCFVGHSYGGAAANILALHVKSRSPQTTVKVLTFGEPKSYIRLGKFPEVDFHGRVMATGETTPTLSPLINIVDPVTLMPPSQLAFFGFGFGIKLARTFLGLGWSHQGERYFLTTSSKLFQGPAFNFYLDTSRVELYILFYTVIPAVHLHYMASSYLPKLQILWAATGNNKELSGLQQYSLAYVGDPAALPDNLGPSFTAAQINDMWELPPGTVTEANRTIFATVSSAATVEIEGGRRSGQTLLGGSAVSALLIPVTFKGTYHNSQFGEGTSESYFYTGNPTAFGYGQMLAKMKALWPFRTQLSMCTDNQNCKNPFDAVACTVQNEQIFRDAVTTSMGNWPNVSYISPKGPVNSGSETTAQWGQSTYNNDDADAVWKAQFLDGQGHEALQYFHGVPLFSQVVTAGSTASPQNQLGGRLVAPSPAWLKALNNFCNALVNLELGFRFSWHIWEPAGIKTPDYPTGAPAVPGNSTPLLAYYNLPGLPPNVYTFTMPQSSLATVLTPFVQVNSKGRYRVIVRGMKALGAINGRWPAIGWTSAGPPPGFTGPYPAAAQFCLTVIRRAAMATFDAQGDVCPEAWSAMVPLPAVPAAGSPNPPGVANIILGTKKTGRPFDLQRGRSAIRKT